MGLAWCGYIAFPTGSPAPCLTSGCALFRDSRVAGISLWWIGGAYFFLLTIICLRGLRGTARIFARIALFLDCLLLLVMFLTSPCVDCLVVAVFFALTFFSLRPKGGDNWNAETPSPSLLLPIWFGLFLGNAALALNEYVPQWAIRNEQNTETRIYFAPSCPACRDALVTYGNIAALYPVEEKPGDLEAVIRLEHLLKTGVPMRTALTRSLDTAEPLPPISETERIVYSVLLLRNKAAVLRQGFKALPLIQVNGMPAGAHPPAESATPPPAMHEEHEEMPDAAAPAQPAVSAPLPEAAPLPAPASSAPAPQNPTTGVLPDGEADRNAAGQTTQPRNAQRTQTRRAMPNQPTEPLPWNWDLNNMNQCGQGTQVPCDEPGQTRR